MQNTDKASPFISRNAQHVLKVLHLLAVSSWIGGYLSEVLLYYTSGTAQSGGELFGILRSSRFISTYVVVYLGAFGSFFTGLAYSLCTNRGFFRHRWVIIKWIGTFYLIYCGTTRFGPWSVKMLETAQELGLEAIADQAYVEVRIKFLRLLCANMVVFVFLTAISVFKPWEVRESIRLWNKKLRVEDKS